jgi:hypothetical protein
VAAAVLGLLGGCAFRHQLWQKADPPPAEQSKFMLRFVEFDDEGWLWQPQRATETIATIEDTVKRKNTVVVTFVHGWHHSARSDDENVKYFKQTLGLIHEQISSKAHREFLQKEGDQAQTDVQIIGIYVGWRGRSLPGLLNYITFWGRKGAAERVGETDFREFLQRLQKVYLANHPEKRPINGQAQKADPQHFLGMVTIGHSFGGQLLLKAVTSSLESQLVAKSEHAGYLRDSTAGVTENKTVKLDGVGDLIILVNPAAEASQYQRLHALGQMLRYEPTQTPVILTLSAVTDYPRHNLFTIGRVLGEIFTGRPLKADKTERLIERQALGVYKGQVTHELQRFGRADSLTRDDSVANECKVRSYDFSRATFAQVSLQPKEGKEVAKPIAYQPFIVADVSDEIIKGHNGIFTETFRNFLVPYVTFLETKILFNLTAPPEQCTGQGAFVERAQ